MTWATTFNVLKGRIMEGGQLTWMVVLSIVSVCVAVWLASPGKTSTQEEEEAEEEKQQEGEEEEKKEGEQGKSKKPKKGRDTKPKAD
jgi:hypothetical protein